VRLCLQMSLPLLVRLEARDRALLIRCAIAPTASPVARARWTALTHLGSSPATISAAALPWFACCALHEASRLAMLTLAISHAAVQLLKRTAIRGRPSAGADVMAVVPEPDRFSFPSGHATASMALALAYGSSYPALAGPLLLLALGVGFSRIRLGVHYPSDVVAGQLIAAATAAALVF
jgi:undecaprenyl-diphosphatase